MDIRPIKGNTWVLEGMEWIPFYKLDERRCILLDTGLLGGAGGPGAGPPGPRPDPGGHPVLPRPCGPRGEQPVFSGEVPDPGGPSR